MLIIEKSSQSTSNDKEQLKESLSALMDGEASELELRRILKYNDEVVDEQWHRYQLASSAIRGKLQLHKPMDLSTSIAELVANEPVLSAKVNNTSRRIWSNLGRLSVAASVAGALVVGVQFASFNTAVNVVEAPIAPVTSPIAGNPDLAPDTSVRVVGTQGQPAEKQQIIIKEATQQQLQQMENEVNRLMLEHAENASQNTQQGVVPYVRVPDGE